MGKRGTIERRSAFAAAGLLASLTGFVLLPASHAIGHADDHTHLPGGGIEYVEARAKGAVRARFAAFAGHDARVDVRPAVPHTHVPEAPRHEPALSTPRPASSLDHGAGSAAHLGAAVLEDAARVAVAVEPAPRPIIAPAPEAQTVPRSLHLVSLDSTGPPRA